MKKLTQEDDLTLIKEVEFTITPSYREMIFYTFMIVLYYSTYARTFFWIVFSLIMLTILISLWRTIIGEDAFSLIIKELRRRGIYKK